MLEQKNAADSKNRVIQVEYVFYRNPNARIEDAAGEPIAVALDPDNLSKEDRQKVDWVKAHFAAGARLMHQNPVRSPIDDEVVVTGRLPLYYAFTASNGQRVNVLGRMLTEHGNTLKPHHIALAIAELARGDDAKYSDIRIDSGGLPVFDIQASAACISKLYRLRGERILTGDVCRVAISHVDAKRNTGAAPTVMLPTFGQAVPLPDYPF
jgi:hypothetical protein